MNRVGGGHLSPSGATRRPFPPLPPSVCRAAHCLHVTAAHNCRRPTLEEHLRRTDRDVPGIGGIRPKSVFQIGGAGAVGTGSIRGMSLLKRLSDAGFAVWPFDSAQFPLVVEIYPRLLTGSVKKG